MSKINELFNIKVKVIIITGGTGLLRTEYAKILASNGARIIVIDVDEKRCKEETAKLEREFKNKMSFRY